MMAEVLPFRPARNARRGGVAATPQPASPCERVLDAHRLVAIHEGGLRLPEDPASGYAIIARTAITLHLAHAGHDATSAFLARLWNEL